ncbi:DUF1028 domain-containing protein [Blastococcus mobilis]|uniref:Uncharacterized conserved protein, Ntn-hydrolase superfamily n=1 Tax=Blastococcus mobilis TaxID=1938746 RepID=A0A238XYP5_9ACTN|nr:DUF1028 domain-containing protein [Blastococcus mobilis]SNR63543.1 Uncharacterized conserved protein, Ntn-hydrolase superfamily [Blastococcus mobilis]
MTYSIVARDPDTGEMGVATQSQAFAVGNSVPFALPGHGVIATQSMAEPMYGSVGLDLLQGGFTAQEVLTALSSVDPQPQRRQVAVLGVNGDLAAYTGEQCVEAAGHLIGDGCVALANMAASAAVWIAMVERFENSSGPLAQRLLNSLEAAEEAGGDFRGRRSAAIMVIRATTTGRPWHDMEVDLRVDDSPDPVAALAELLMTRARYQDVVRAFQQAIDGDPLTADRELELLRPMDPVTEPDQLMWRAVVAALAGREDAARKMLAELTTTAPQFLEAARRFGKAGLMPAEVIERIVPAS